MIELLNTALLAGGALAAAAPVIIHIAHRRKYKQMEWGAMRFLLEMLMRKRRRMMIEQWLLLLVRMMILIFLGLALCRPALNLSRDEGSDALTRQGQTAAVLLIDDSLSSGAGRGKPVLDAVKRLAIAYLNTLQTGDEISIVPLSRLGAPPADPVFDIEAAKSMVDSLKPTAVASDLPALLEAGLAQLARHINPGAELVVISDGRKDGQREGETLRWEELRRRLRGAEDAKRGTKSRPRVVMLAPEAHAAENNLAVTAVRIDRTLIPTGRPVSVRVELSHHGDEAAASALLRLYVNGRAVGERPLDSKPNKSQEVTFTHTFSEPGSYVIEAGVEGAHDILPLDDRRALSVQVERSVPALLVEGDPGEGIHGSLGLAAAALDPVGDGSDLFAITRIPASMLGGQELQGFRVVVLSDVAALDAQSVAALERFVVAGGGILMAPGPHTDIELANRFLARGGHGFLAAGFASVATPDVPLAPANAALTHPAFNAFSARANEAWKTGKVRQYLRLDQNQLKAVEVAKLLTLENGEPLVIERSRGLGRSILMTTSLDLEWNDLPLQPSYVPLVRGLVSYLGSALLPPRNLKAGDRLTYCPDKSGAALAATLEGPAGGALPFAVGSWEGRDALVSEPLLEPGGYVVREPGSDRVVRFAITTSPEESLLRPQTADDIAQLFKDASPLRYSSPEQVTAAFSLATSRSVEIWRWLVLASLAMMFVETLLTRRQVGAEQAAARPTAERLAGNHAGNHAGNQAKNGVAA